MTAARRSCGSCGRLRYSAKWACIRSTRRFADPSRPASNNVARSMSGLLALVLHAHLPFVRHPEHERFLEENWLHEAVTDSYLPLLGLMDEWTRDRLPWRMTLTLTPTLCAMLSDPLLQS